MHITIHHTITDQQKWEQGSKRIMELAEQGRLPQGLKGLMFLPSVDGRRADCLWEANSMEALRTFIDRETAGGARNEYFQVNDAAAMGLPGREEMRKAA
ncbi:MAG: hypothetical protein ABSA45_06445 [Verrucomicrobiota bacterium]